MLIDNRQTRWLSPDWPAPVNVQAVVSTRQGQLSPAPFDGFNTADHVGADPLAVQRCRQLFQQRFHLLQQPQWLDQVHGIEVVEAQADGRCRTADASFSRQPGLACTLHTADCLPVFFCDRQGTQVALAHAGWRGLVAGVLEATLRTFDCDRKDVICWIGPAIQQADFEVGNEVRQQFLQSGQPIPAQAFVSSSRVSEAGPHYYCDLMALAKARIDDWGVQAIYGGALSSFNDSRFFSYRKSAICGRTLSAIWLSNSA